MIYDPDKDQYLVVWEDSRQGNWDVYGQLISGAGQVVGDNFPIAPYSGDHKYPQVAYNSRDNEYLVVWEGHRGGSSDIYGRHMSGDGQPLGDAFPIAEGGSDQGAPALAYDSNANEYLVVWQDARNAPATGTDIYGQRVSSSGQLVGGALPICTAPQAQYAPVVAYGEGEDGYLVVWHDLREREATERDIYGRRVSGLGQPRGGDFALSRAVGDQRYPAIAYDGIRNKYLVVWEDYRNSSATGADIYARKYQVQGKIYLPLILKGHP